MLKNNNEPYFKVNYPKKSIKITVAVSIALVAVSSFFASRVYAETSAKNVIIFIGDGMGTEHIKAGGMLANGGAGTLSFESFPHQSSLTTSNSLNGITDSAAGATAIATGVKVINTVVSLATDGTPLTTLLELHKADGKSTGLVTTSYMEDASPAAFGAHELSRANYDDIVDDYLTGSRPNVLFGGGGIFFSPLTAAAAGYKTVTDLSTMQSLDTETTSHIAGAFGFGEIAPLGSYNYDETLPSLAEMTTTALKVLDNDSDGLFLFVEHEGSDTHSHNNNTTGSPEAAIRSVVELSDAVQAAVDWAANHPNTIILVTSDHETGGLTVTEETPVAGQMPATSWLQTSHTSNQVPVYAMGIEAGQVALLQENTDIFHVLKPAPVSAFPVAITDNITAAVNTPVTIDVLENDTGEQLTINDFNQYSHHGGTISKGRNSLIYTSEISFSGRDTFWYAIEDNLGRTNSTKVTIEVSGGSNDPLPVGKPDTASAADVAITIDALANDIGTGLTLLAPNPWSLKGGNVSLSGNKISYTPQPGYNGEDKIWYDIKDVHGRDSWGVITINVTSSGTFNPAPVGKPDTTSASAAKITIDVLANDVGNGLVLVANPSANGYSLKGGTVSLSDNKLIYNAKADFEGEDKIWYNFEDVLGRISWGEVTINVTH